MKEILNFPVSFLKIDKDCSWRGNPWSDLRCWLNGVLDFVIFQNYKLDYYDRLKYQQAARDFSVSSANYDSSYNNGLKMSSLKKSGVAYTRMSLTVFCDFFNNKKSQDDVANLLAYLALNSIIGDLNDYSRTNFAMMFARMSGFNSPKDKGFKMPKEVSYYDKEYRRNKLINSLRLDWGLHYYAARGIRGFYVSFKDLEVIVRAAEQHRRSRRLKEIRDETAAIRSQVLKEFHSRP